MGIFADPYPGDREEQKDKRIAELEAALAERKRTIERLERCLHVWVGNLFPMATPEQNTRRIAAIKRSAHAEEESP